MDRQPTDAFQQPLLLGSASCLISSPECLYPLVWSFEHHCLWYMKWSASAPFIPPLPCCSEGPTLTQTQVRTCCVGGSAWASGSCWVLGGRHISPPGCRNCSEVELAYLPGPGPPFLAWKLRSREVEPHGYGCSAKHSRVGCLHSPVAMFLFRQSLVFPAWG